MALLDGRADEAGDHPGGREHREHPGPDGGRVGAADGGVGDGGDGAGADALEHPSGDEHAHRRGQPAEAEAGREEHQADEERERGAPLGRRPGPAITMPRRLPRKKPLNTQP